MVIDDIRSRGFIRAGVSLGFHGFSDRDPDTGRWDGFDVELARAVASAILGDADAVEFRPLASADRFAFLDQGEIDLGTFNASVTQSRDLLERVRFTHPMLFDGEALLTRAAHASGHDADDALLTFHPRIAALRGSTTEANLRRFFESRQLKCDILLYTSPAEAREAYEAGHCDMYCLDRYLLSGERTRLSEPAEHTILPYVVSREVMAPFVSEYDQSWYSTVTWIMRSLIEAESIGIVTEGDIGHFDSKPNTYEHRFLNPSRSICEKLNLDTHFVKSVIGAVGHYGTLFENTLGEHSDIQAPRRENRPWAHGGLLWCPNFI